MFPVHQRGPRGALTAGRNTEGPGEVQPEEPPDTFLAKTQQAKEAEWK